MQRKTLLSDELIITLHVQLLDIKKIIWPLNDQHEKTEKPVVHCLLHAFCCLIDRSYFLASKAPFSIFQKNVLLQVVLYLFAVKSLPTFITQT